MMRALDPVLGQERADGLDRLALGAHLERAHDHGRQVGVGFEKLGLHAQRPDEPVEVGRDDHVRVARLDGLDGGAQTGTAVERGPARHVQLVQHVEQP